MARRWSTTSLHHWSSQSIVSARQTGQTHSQATCTHPVELCVHVHTCICCRSVCVGCIIWLLLPGQPTIVHLYQASELGSRLTLVCEVDCSPVLACSVSWLYNGLDIDHTNPTMYTVSSNGSIHNLSVLQPGEGEVGKYTCVLRSRFEVEDSKTVQLVLPGETVG